MRLTKPGVYVARDGRVAMSINGPHGDLIYSVRGTDGYGSYIYCSLDTEGDWQRVDLDAIKWPKLPPKPPQCLVTYEDDGPFWRQFCDGECACSGLLARNYTVVPHPDNDPEAVAMIEAARKEAAN